MQTDQQIRKRLRDEFHDIETKHMWNITFRVSKFKKIDKFIFYIKNELVLFFHLIATAIEILLY